MGLCADPKQDIPLTGFAGEGACSPRLAFLRTEANLSSSLMPALPSLNKATDSADARPVLYFPFRREGVCQQSVQQGKTCRCSNVLLTTESEQMVILTRKKNEGLVIGDNIIVTVIEIRGDKVRLQIESPPDASVHRRELYDAIHRVAPQAEPR